MLANFSSLYVADSSAAAPASRWTQWHRIQTVDTWQLRPSTTTGRSAMERVSHQVSFQLWGTTRLILLSRGSQLRDSFERGYGVSPTCLGLFCKQNCEARKRQLVNCTDTDAGYRDLGPASHRLQPSPPRHLISIRTRRWTLQTANLHCVGKRQLRMMSDGMPKPH